MRSIPKPRKSGIARCEGAFVREGDARNLQIRALVGHLMQGPSSTPGRTSSAAMCAALSSNGRMRGRNQSMASATALWSRSRRLPTGIISTPTPSSRTVIADAAQTSKFRSSQSTTRGDGAGFRASEITLVSTRITRTRLAVGDSKRKNDSCFYSFRPFPGYGWVAIQCLAMSRRRVTQTPSRLRM